MSGQAILALVDGALTILAVAVALLLVAFITRHVSRALGRAIEALNAIPDEVAGATPELERARRSYEELRGAAGGD